MLGVKLLLSLDCMLDRMLDRMLVMLNRVVECWTGCLRCGIGFLGMPDRLFVFVWIG